MIYQYKKRKKLFINIYRNILITKIIQIKINYYFIFVNINKKYNTALILEIIIESKNFLFCILLLIIIIITTFPS